MSDDRPRVLVIDDDEVDRETARHALIDGYEVIEAGTAAEGIAQLLQHGADCVVLDYHLPDANGLDLVPKLTRAGAGVIFVTAHGDEEVASAAMKAGSLDYLPKAKAHGETLRRTVSEVIRRTALQRELDIERRRLREVNAVLESTNAELDRFTGAVAHDVQAPLRKIASFSERILEDGESSAAVRDYVERIERSAAKASALVTNLLALARAASGPLPKEHVSWSDVVRDVTEVLDMDLRESGVTLEVGELPTTSANPTQLRQMFQNLVSNAIRYRHPERPQVVTIRGTRDAARNWTIEVRDRGKGFAPEQALAIFKAFHRADHSGSGSGLGLATCQRITERHGWTIEAESQPGEGATFRIRVPRDLAD